jgi:hypothetical protein
VEVLLTFFGCLAQSYAAVNVDCHFFMSPFGTNLDVYQCDTKNLYVVESTVVSRVFGEHMKGKDNLDVERLHIEQQTCHFMPKGFEIFFPNLKAIRIASSGLKTLGSADLKPFPRLIAIDVPFNDIVTLKSDIFKHNLKLKYVFFPMNKIQNVGRNVLAPLNNLLSVSFSKNLCIDQSADRTETIKALQQRLNTICAEPENNDCF